MHMSRGNTIPPGPYPPSSRFELHNKVLVDPVAEQAPRGKAARLTAAAAAATRPDDGFEQMSSILGLRGLLTLLVVAFHLRLPCSPSGWVLMSGLFAISGARAASVSLRAYEQCGEVCATQFFQRRVARLAPSVLLVVSSVCSYVACVRILRPTELSGVQMHRLRWDMLSAAAFASNAHLTNSAEDYFSHSATASLLMPFWSIAVEEQVLLFWPILLAAAVLAPSVYGLVPALHQHSHLRMVYLVVFCLCVAVCCLSWSYGIYMQAAGSPAYSLQYSALCHAKSFAIGGAAAAVVRLTPLLKGLLFSDAEYMPKLSPTGIAVADLLAGLLLLQLLGWAEVLPLPWTRFESRQDVQMWYISYGGVLVAAVACVLLITLAALEKETAQAAVSSGFRMRVYLALSSPPLVQCGVLSQQLYLWHLPFALGLGAVFTGSWDHKYLMQFVVFTFILFCTSKIIYAFFEYNMMAKILKSRSSRVFTVLVLMAVVLAGLVYLITNNAVEPPPMDLVVHSSQVPNNRTSTAYVANSAGWRLTSAEDAVKLGEACRKQTAASRDMQYITFLTPHIFRDQLALALLAATNNTINSRYCSTTAKSTQRRCPDLLSASQPLVNEASKGQSKRKYLIVTGSLTDAREQCTLVQRLRSGARNRSSTAFYFLHLYDSAVQGLPLATNLTWCAQIPHTDGVLKKVGSSEYVDRVVAVDMNAALNDGPLLTFRNRSQQLVKDTWFPRGNAAPMVETAARYSVYSLIIEATKRMPEFAPFFRCSVFDEYTQLVEQSKSISISNRNSERTVDTVVYMGGSLATYFAVLVEHSRTRLLYACRDRFADYLHADINTAPFHILPKIMFESVAQTQCSVVETPACNDLKRLAYIVKEKHATRFIVQDDVFLSLFLAETARDDGTQWKQFRQLLNFLNTMQEAFRARRVYFHDLHGNFPTTLLPSGGLNQSKTIYSLLVSAIDKRFKACKALLSKWDGKVRTIPTCISQEIFSIGHVVGNKTSAFRALDKLKSIIRVLDVSSIMCPQPTSSASGRYVLCPKGAWGWPRMLPDGVHPGGPTGDFAATHLLGQLAVDMYFDDSVTKHRPITELLRYRTFHEFNSSVAVRSIKHFSSLGTEAGGNVFLRAIRDSAWGLSC